MSSHTEGLVCVHFRLLLAFLQLIGTIYNAFLNILVGNTSTKRVPRTENDLFKKSAKQIASEIRRRKISSFYVVSEFIERQKQVNPVINAIVADRYNEALREAKEVDDFLATQTTLSEIELANSKPLLGVPVSIKESISVKGMNLAVGSKARIGIKAEEHAACTRKLIEAGAIPLCVTTTPELCLDFETNNLVTGRTNNPYNVFYVAGGSSGGEGALISTGGSVVGIGSDLSGSIRIPAAFCGIFGHKLSTGVIDPNGHFPFIDSPVFLKHISIGPMSRFAEDLPLITKIITDNNPLLQLDEPVKISNLKFFYMVDSGNCFGSMSVHAKIKQRIRESIEHFRTNWDCEISDYKFEEAQYINEANMALILTLEEKSVAQVNAPWEILKTMVGKSDFSISLLGFLFLKNNTIFLPRENERIKEFLAFFDEKITAQLGENGVFLYPTFPSSAFRHGASFFSINAVPYAALANLLGLPATTIPVGFIENGLPIGIQVIAARNQDRLCMAVAKELENVFGGWIQPY